MAEEGQDGETDYAIKFREEEELEFFTELAVHETERWIQAVTKKTLAYPDDTRKSLENGVLLCELLNALQPGAIKRINKLPTPIAGLDNINVFLRACRSTFGLGDVHLFNPSDLEDLSQRAIAESDHLKEEYDRRLRNVVISIYWLGKYASRHFQGPQLDFSAYSALIHHRQEAEIVERSSRGSSGSSWEWSHAGRVVVGGLGADQQYHHMRESSFDSYEKESVDSLDELSHDSTMPLSRYSSASALSRNRDAQQLSTLDSSLNEDNRHMYRSSPDLVQPGGTSHRRYSSTDSMDGSHHSGHSSHSRQGSDSQEVTYPTRRLSSQQKRKQSASADPLQFIKLKGAQDLAHTAEVQLRVAAENKKDVTVARAKDEDADWQANLSTWKNRRKSQSERTYQLREELEQMEKEKDGETATGPPPQPKTFAQMQEERERRRSTSRKFYPIEDEENDDDSAFVPASSRTSGRSASTVTEPKDGIAAWARDSDDENDKENQSHTGSKTDQNDNNINSKNSLNNKSHKEDDYAPRSSSRSKLVQKLRAFDDDDNNSDFSKVSSNRDTHGHRFGVPEHSGDSARVHATDSLQCDVNSPNKSGYVSGRSADFSRRGEVKSRNNDSFAQSSEPVSRRSESFNKTKDVFNKSESTLERDTGNTKITTKNVGSRNQGKIGSIMKNFEDSSAKTTLPKQGYNEKIDLSARKHAFENPPEESHRSNVATNRPGRSVKKIWQREEESSEEEEESFTANRYHKTSAATAFTPPSDTSSTSTNQTQLPTSASPPSTLPTSSAAENSETRTESNKNFVQKMIKISQKRNNDRGFGFFLTGGADKPLTVSKVSLGSAADICDLKVKDMVLSVNQTNVSGMTTGQVGDIIAGAVNAGYIEIQIQREPEEDDLDDEEFDSSSDEGEEDISSPSYKFSQPRVEESSPGSSVMSQLAAEREWLEQQIKAGEADKAKDYPDQATDQTNRLEIETRATLTVNKPNTERDTNLLSPASVEIKHSPNSSLTMDEDSDGGPPAILRKWQRQRQKEEFAFDADHKEVSDTYKRISLNARLPRRDSDDFNARESARNAESAGESMKSWDNRMNEWTQRQDQERHDAPASAETTQARFAADQSRLRDIYEQDMQRAEERSDEKRKQEEDLLKNETDHTRLLEERRAERRARIQQSAASSFEQPSHSFQTSAPAESHITAVTYNVVPQQQQQQQQQQQYELNSALYKPGVTVTPHNRFVIDSKNRHTDSAAAAPVQFHVKVGSQPVVDETAAALLEEERERIRQEELRKIEEERRRLEEEQRAREEEEMRRIKEKEYELQKEKEKLQQEREKFLREQEEFKRMKELQQQQQQQQQQQLQQQHQSPNYSSPPQRQQHPLSSSQGHKSVQPRDASPGKYAPVSFQPHNPGRSERQQYQNSNAISGYSSQPQQQQQQHHHHFHQQQQQPEQNPWRNTQKSSSVPKWQPGNNLASRDLETDFGRDNRRFSREEMLAMNRKATPLQESGVSHQDNTEPSLQSAGAPITREAPSRGEIHSLNSVPKAKLRKDGDWYSSAHANSPAPAKSPRQPEAARYKPPWQEAKDDNTGKLSLSGPGDHWLVQEAERRRIAESEGRHPSGRPGNRPSQTATVTGPIKPAGDSYNRWRDNNGYSADQSQHGRPGSMPAAIRQTLLQKTAVVRGSSELAPPQSSPHGSRSSSRSPSHNYHNRSLSPQDLRYTEHQPHHHQQHYQHHPETISQSRLPTNYAAPPSHAPPSPNENGMPVSGGQLCSHCNEELGFGAAMVIETLGLIYHLQCFRCCVCHASLGTGAQGADVRVKANKLHCPNCYSNDEAGLKFSKV